MMPQQEFSEGIHQHADPDYRRYEGNQTSSARPYDETFYQQDVREEPSGKVYPLPRDRANILCFALSVIALGMVLLFGLLFVVGIGGMGGWISFAVACMAIFVIAGTGITSLRSRG